MHPRIEVKVIATATVEFFAYEHKSKAVAKKLNQKAIRSIQRYVKELLNDEASFITVAAEKDDDGSDIEDCTRKCTWKVKVK